MFRRHDSGGRGERAGADAHHTGRLELPRRVVDVPVAPSAAQPGGYGAPTTGRVAVGGETGPVLVQSGRADAATAEPARQLVVGPGVELKGEVKGCERLTVDGDLEATVAASEHLIIGAEGGFRGSCEVESADIAGSFDGALHVRGRLLVRASGRVQGEIRFGELEIERGCQLSGNVDAHAKGPQLATVAAAGGD